MLKLSVLPRLQTRWRDFWFDPKRQGLFKLLIALLLVLTTVLAYRPAHNFEMLLYDDLEHIVYNPSIIAEPGFERWQQIWTKPYFDLYVPVTYSFWAVAFDYSIRPEVRRGDPLVIAREGALTRTLHLMNLMFHAGNVVWVWLIFLQMRAAIFPAALGALVFALHPLQVESVAWISELRGVLAVHFGLISLWLWIGVMTTRSHQPINKHKNWILVTREIASLCCFCLSLLAKPSVVVLPGFAIVCARYRLDCSWKQIIQKIAPWLLAVGLAIAVTSILQKDLIPLWPWWQRLFVAGDSLWFYTAKFFWPEYLLIDYSRRPDFREISQLFVSALVWVVLGCMAWFARRRSDLLVAGGLWLIGLSSQLGLISSLYQSISTVADRYAYLGLLGPAFAAACVGGYCKCAERTWKKYWGYFLIMTALFAMAAKTSEQLQVWKQSEMLFAHTLRFNAQSYTSLHGLGDLASLQSDQSLAEYYYREAIKARPEFAQGYASLGKALLAQGRLEEARDALGRSLSINRENASARLNFGVSLQRLRDYERALREYLALIAETKHPLAYFNAGTVYVYKQMWVEAEACFLQALELNPHLHQAHAQLGRIYEQLGKIELRDQHLRAARSHQEKDPGVK